MFFNPFHPKRVKEGGWKLQGEGGLHQVLRQFTFKGVTFEVTSSSCTTRPLLPKELLHDAVSRASHFPTLNVFLMVETWPTTREKIREWGNVGDGIGERRFCATIFKSPSLDKKKKKKRETRALNSLASLFWLSLSLWICVWKLIHSGKVRDDSKFCPFLVIWRHEHLYLTAVFSYIHVRVCTYISFKTWSVKAGFD